MLNLAIARKYRLGKRGLTRYLLVGTMVDAMTNHDRKTDNGPDRPRRLNARFVDRVKEPGRFGDGWGGYGLSLLVKLRAHGGLAKSWAQRLQIDGKGCNLGLGPYPIVTLAEARELALENRRALQQGRDPRKGSTLPSFQVAAGKYHKQTAPTWRGAKTADAWWSSMAKHVFPAIGAKPVDEVTRADVLAVVTTPILTAKRATATKVLQRIGSVMVWAVAEGWRADNPAVSVVAALPKNNTAPANHHKALRHQDVAGAVEKIRDSGARPGTKLMIEYTILTACRSGEAREATWDEVDHEAATWTVPAERMKTGKVHRVPLSARAVAILGEAKALAGNRDLIFPTPGGKAINDGTATKLLREIGINGVMHGFRTSFRSWAAEQNTPREIAEASLAHIVRGVEGAYQRSDLFELRRALMERWAAYVTNPTG